MAFKCCIEHGSVEFDLIDMGAKGFIVSALIGIDWDHGRTYLINVALTPYEEDGPEYSFCIVERNAETGEEKEYWSGRAVTFIPKDDRLKILSLTIAATEHLFSIVKPRKVYRCTYDANPPEEALEKHYVIGQVFAHCGYRVTQCDDWHGKRTWIAVLSESD